MHFILFGGNNRTGKSTMSKCVVEMMSRGCHCRVINASFSDELRNEVIELYGVPSEVVHDKHVDKNNYMFRLGDFIYDSSLPELWKEFKFIKNATDFDETVVSLRELLIKHATDIRRTQDPNYWINKFKTNMAKLTDIDVVVVDDPRFVNEFECNADNQTVFWLKNTNAVELDKVEKAALAWYEANKDRVIEIEMPIPVLKYNAETIFRNQVFKQVPALLNAVTSGLRNHS